MQVDRIVLLDREGRRHLVGLDKDVVTVPGLGVVRADVLRSMIGRRWTIGNRAFLVLTPSIRDLVGSIKRKAQIVTPKDAACIVWNSDLKAGDVVIEAGAGSGALTLAIAHAVGPTGHVVSYDARPDFLDVARENVAAAGLSAIVDFKVGDIRQGVPERGVDAVILDIPDPWAALAAASEALRPSGHLASYSPNVEQTSRLVRELRARTFADIRTVEIIEREIEVGEAGTHPSFAPLGHTGYLTFARKVLEAAW